METQYLVASEKHVHSDGALNPGFAEHAFPSDIPSGYGELYLLGLWHGNWEVDDTKTVRRTIVRNPAGYRIVVPADKIIEVLDAKT